MTYELESEKQFVAEDWLVLLDKLVLPKLYMVPRRSIRAWVLNSGTGELAHALAVLLIEHQRLQGLDCDVRVFGTELDESRLSIARRPDYLHDLRARVLREMGQPLPSDRLHHQLLRQARDCVLFSKHHVLKDPPFSRIDLAVGEQAFAATPVEARPQLVELLHYSLAPEGLLLLGDTEAPRGMSEFFTPVADDLGLFKARGDRSALASRFRNAAARSKSVEPHARPEHLANALLLEKYAPPCIVLDEAHAIVRTSGAAERYLQSPTGLPTNAVLDLLRPELRPLVAAMLECRSSNSLPPAAAMDFELDGMRSRLALAIHALEDSGLRALVFTESDRRPAELQTSGRSARTEHDMIAHIRRELDALRSEFVSSSEELNRSNEDLRSLNEELESANHELERARTELQAANEELENLNEELRTSMEELGRTHRDLHNLFENTCVAAVFLDRELRVRSFTPASRDLFSLISTDVGRPISDIAPQFSYDDLDAAARRVMAQGRPSESQVKSSADRWYVLKILPYRVNTKQIDGVVLTFSDVTELKLAELEVSRLNVRLSTQLRWLRAMTDVPPPDEGLEPEPVDHVPTSTSPPR
ncbi:MAG: PAS domain-containing protein [Myxococcota bacterium]